MMSKTKKKDKKKKLVANFKIITKCRKCDKNLDKNLPCEHLRLDLCSECNGEYLDMKKYLDKYSDKYNIDKHCNETVGCLISQYSKTKDFDEIFFSEYQEKIYQFLCKTISPPSSECDEDSSDESTSNEDEEQLLEQQRKLAIPQMEQLERAEKENENKINDFLEKNPDFRLYCRNHFEKGIPGDTKERRENMMILYLLSVINKGCTGGMTFNNTSNPLGLEDDELSKLKRGKYSFRKYYAESGYREGKFRFVILIETTSNKIVRIYFTSNHYKSFITIKI